MILIFVYYMIIATMSSLSVMVHAPVNKFEAFLSSWRYTIVWPYTFFVALFALITGK